MLTIVRHFERVALRRSAGVVPLAILAVSGLVYAGCGQTGSITDTIPTVDQRDLSGIAGPTDASQLRPVERVPRAQFAEVGNAPLTLNDTPFFVYPSADDFERDRAHRAIAALSCIRSKNASSAACASVPPSKPLHNMRSWPTSS